MEETNYKCLDNAKALELALDKYADRLIAFINSFVQDIYSAEDIMMDAFVDIIVKKPQFNDETAFRAYLFKCAKNKSINYIKKYRRLVAIDENMLEDKYNLENKIINSFTSKLIYNSMEKLPKKYKMVLYLNYIEGFSQQEVAEIMNLNSRQIRNINYQAKKKLNAILKNKNLILE